MLSSHGNRRDLQRAGPPEVTQGRRAQLRTSTKTRPRAEARGVGSISGPGGECHAPVTEWKKQAGSCVCLGQALMTSRSSVFLIFEHLTIPLSSGQAITSLSHPPSHRSQTSFITASGSYLYFPSIILCQLAWMRRRRPLSFLKK